MCRALRLPKGVEDNASFARGQQSSTFVTKNISCRAQGRKKRAFSSCCHELTTKGRSSFPVTSLHEEHLAFSLFTHSFFLSRESIVLYSSQRNAKITFPSSHLMWTKSSLTYRPFVDVSTCIMLFIVRNSSCIESSLHVYCIACNPRLCGCISRSSGNVTERDVEEFN